ncbi:LVIVD repeat-containing protein [Gelidibacter pelagius]|uniref:LVIVD repeat-containing protein n=1 Tax=Gelidibacter pelagius TaxID=2819985 RepID=A0ABS3SXG1_9FLAO|nr:hypothetical protein [Gelidibacter pelagius]MBO3099578.1 hypothetical protein [Gelidibacter pelagius]
MKQIIFIFAFVCLWSCQDDDNGYEIINVAIPEMMSKTEFRNSVEIQSAKPIVEAGKIYAYDDYIFISDKDVGVHVIDNSKPKAPKTISYLKIPGNEDMSIKNNYLYADSATDLLVFDISDILNITFIERLEDVFSAYDYQIPNEAEYADFNNFDFENQIVVGWKIVQERREIIRNSELVFNDAALSNSSSAESSSVGVGGSLARFQIVQDYLYTVGSHEMSIFNISQLSAPVLETVQPSGWNIETMFYADDYLYLGGTNGMYIFSMENPASPSYVSQFTHWEGCDPVVVDGNYAYLTLRGGNACGQLESVLEVIDISDKANPTLAARHTLDNPYGLGFKNNSLFVCDGTSGLKVFDKTNPLELQQIQAFPNVHAKDVIPLNNSLLMIGDGVMYQYQYDDNGLQLLSTYSLN